MTDIPFDFETSGISFVELNWQHRWLNSGRRTSLLQSRPLDDEGVGVWNVGGKYYGHPLNLAAFILTRLDQFTTNQDEEFLELIRRNAERLISRAVPRGDAVFFPFEFPWDLHHQIASPMPVPWYSGMAQAYGLAAFSRLYEVLRDERYLDFAHRIFHSYFYLDDGKSPFFVDLIDGENLWFEEYAISGAAPGSATNGHLYAAFCLHDYWTVTGDERAIAIADGGFTTTLKHMDRFRRPGGQSFYGINSPKSTAQYHHWHALQLGHIYNVTGSPLWVRLQELFMEDYPTQTGPEEPHSAKLIVNPGTYSVGERGDLTVTSHVEIDIAERRELAINVRAKRYGELATSTRVLDPEFEYMWFTEEPDNVYVSGISERAAWAHSLDYEVVGETLTVFQFDETAEDISTVDSNFTVGDNLKIDERASIRGRIYVHLIEGVEDHHWVPADNLKLIYE